jgi:hypothetical protein
MMMNTAPKAKLDLAASTEKFVYRFIHLPCLIQPLFGCFPQAPESKALCITHKRHARKQVVRDATLNDLGPTLQSG